MQMVPDAILVLFQLKAVFVIVFVKQGVAEGDISIRIVGFRCVYFVIS